MAHQLSLQKHLLETLKKQAEMNYVIVEVERNINIVMENNTKLKAILFLLGLNFLLLPNIQAQNGEVTVLADSMLKVITNNRVWRRPAKITGYRMLVYIGDRSNAEKEVAKFRAMFPDEPVMMKWDEPNFKVVGGLFYSKKDAQAFRAKCSHKFNMLIVINELVDLPPVTEKPEEEKE